MDKPSQLSSGASVSTYLPTSMTHRSPDSDVVANRSMSSIDTTEIMGYATTQHRRVAGDLLLLPAASSQASVQSSRDDCHWTTATASIDFTTLALPQCWSLVDGDKSVPSYTLGEVLGVGSYSVVHVAVDNTTGTEWACKMVAEPTSEAVQLQEAQLLAQLDHPSIAKYREHFYHNGKLHIIMELVRGVDLMTAVTSRGCFSVEEAKKVCLQLVSALSHCHERGICHRDIKPENVILVRDAEHMQVKLIDFGLGGQLSNASDTFSEACGTPSFVAPELLCRVPSYGSACDVWSLGVTLYFLLSGGLPFQGTDLPTLLSSVRKGAVSFRDPVWQLVSPEARDTVSSLLTIDKQRRPTAADILSSCPWLSTSH